VIATGVAAVLVAGTVDAIRSSEPSASSPSRETATERSAARETTFPVEAAPESFPRCTAQHIGVSIEVLGGAATIVVRHVWGSPCYLAPLRVRLMVSDRVGRRVRLSPRVESVVEGDFAPGFERLIDITYLPNCHQRGPFTAFVIVGPYSAQRKLSVSDFGCFRGG
jgi:hypothetical protein